MYTLNPLVLLMAQDFLLFNQEYDDYAEFDIKDISFDTSDTQLLHGK